MSEVLLNPYLTFGGNAGEAISFYQKVLGGTLRVQTFRDFGAPVSEGYLDKVMHAHLDADGLVLMASDAQEGSVPNVGDNVSLSLSGDAGQRARLTEVFDKLSDGGSTSMPLGEAPWGALFGMLTDRYGISWLINIDQSAAGSA